MYIMRPISEKDLDAYEEFAIKSSLGVINLPKNREVLREKILASETAFHADIEKPYLENYIFVLEDTSTGELGGTSGICSRMGVTEPTYHFRIQTITNEYTKKEMQILTTVAYPIGPTEIFALYLKPEFRKEGLGKLLSLGRFLFMASYRERFEDYVVAEMRGYIREDNSVPFWDSFCRKFLDVSYDILCEMELQSRAFIPCIIPKWPIYTTLLPKEAQDYMAKTHDRTVPALKMLDREGFVFTQEIDPFDGGPKLGCKIEDIATIKNCEIAIVHAIDNNQVDNSPACILSNTKIEFRACYGQVSTPKKGMASISKEIAQALNVNLGDEIRFVKLSSPKDKCNG